MKGGLRALVVGADAERLGRLAGHLVGRADGVSLELLASGEAAADRLSTPDVDCIAYEVTLDVPPPEGFERSLREATRSVPVVLFGEDGPALDSADIEAADAVVVGPDAEGVDELLASVESAGGDARRPGRPDGVTGEERPGREYAEYGRIVETAPSD